MPTILLMKANTIKKAHATYVIFNITVTQLHVATFNGNIN
jgi:hypothetical protein